MSSRSSEKCWKHRANARSEIGIALSVFKEMRFGKAREQTQVVTSADQGPYSVSGN